MTALKTDPAIEDFIDRWGKSSGKERANFQPFAEHLCAVLGVEKPLGSVEDTHQNVYAYERDVKFPDGTSGRIDLYKRGSFVLEAKQSRQKGGKKELVLSGSPDLFIPDSQPQGKRNASRAWDVLMMNAKRQAEGYAKALPPSEGWPPFVLVCDVGHCIEVYADFTGQGKNYAQFPDRNGYRIYLEDLRDDKIRERLRQIWEAPHALDPTKQSAKATRDIAARLAKVSKALEQRKDKPNPEDVAHFLMRCLFTMFAEDVKLLPEHCFRDWLERARDNTSKFKHELAQLWQAMDTGGYATIAEAEVKKFNGAFFKKATVFELEREEIGELWAAAKADWKLVDPAIFGTLLEQALDPKERAKLGAHYTPRAYVERLVVVTIMEPLRQEWASVQGTAERYRFDAQTLEAETEDRAQKLKTKDQKQLDSIRDARSEARRIRQQGVDTLSAFHHKLCETRVLDPACGTGNFLYVAMEMMKRLEGEVLDAVLDLGGQEALALEKQSVDPHQFLGIELNSRAAAISELVIWLGYLQWFFRTQKGEPSEPILREFKNIQCRDAVLDWDGYPRTAVVTKEGKRVEAFPNAKKPKWPDAEFIVGNPPFIGGGYVRGELGGDYAETLWAVHKDINDSADFVMYWWDRAASLLTAKGTKLRRFGFVTTNSITQDLSGSRVVARHLEAKKPISILMAIPDHPWTKATDDAASVRIAMTVAVAGRHDGVVREVTHESGLHTDEPKIELSEQTGKINRDLSIGVDVRSVEQLTANAGICHDGVKLHGAGFIVYPAEAEQLGLGKRPGLEKHIRHYRNGKDLMATPRGVMVIDLFGHDADDVRKRFPEVYQHILQTVKPERDSNNRASYRDNWWIFGEPRKDLRPALAGLPRYIGTVDTSKHRVFQFLDASIICDDKVVIVADQDAFHLGVLSSCIHVTWALRAGGWLGVGNDSVYVKTRCCDPFPFPDCAEALKAKIRGVAEDIDAHRKARQAEHPKLTLTQMYNVLEKLREIEAAKNPPPPSSRSDAPHRHGEGLGVGGRSGTGLPSSPHPQPLPVEGEGSPVPLTDDEERIKREGLVLILKELHDKLDALVFEGYGWPHTLTDEEILERLVALNKERADEEKTGKVRWLRPEYQRERFGSDADKAAAKAEREKERVKAQQSALDLDDDLQELKPKYPTGDELAETTAVLHALALAPAAVSIDEISATFKGGLQNRRRIKLCVEALTRLGHISSADSGETFTLRRAA